MGQDEDTGVQRARPILMIGVYLPRDFQYLGMSAEPWRHYGQNNYHTILVTQLGIFTLVRRVQKPKAWSPMLVTLAGMVTLVRLVQS